MVNSRVDYMLIIDSNGIPIYTFNLNEKEGEQPDIVLISGFVAAFAQFITSTISGKAEIIQFAQNTFEGMVGEINEHYYCIIGKNLFNFSPSVYELLFNFIDDYYFKTAVKSIWDSTDQLEQLIQLVFTCHKNSNLYVPIQTSTSPYHWDLFSKIVFDDIDNKRNIKELSLSTSVDEQIVFTIIRILQWQKAVRIDMDINQNIILEKTELAIDYLAENEQDYTQIKEYFPDAFTILKLIDGYSTIAELQSRYIELDFMSNILILVEKELVETISLNKLIEVLIYDFLHAYHGELKLFLSKREIDVFFQELFEKDNSLFYYFYSHNRISLINIIDNIKMILKKGYTLENILDNFIIVADEIKLKIEENTNIDAELIENNVSTFIHLKYGNMLTNIDIIDILFPEKKNKNQTILRNQESTEYELSERQER